MTAVARMTRQRAALLDAIDDQEEFRSAQEIHRELQQRGEKVGLATVYRGLQRLAGTGDVDTVKTGEGENLYRRCATREHHHHLVCRVCGRAEEIDGPTVEEWARTTGEAYGFADITHEVELFGTCAACRGSASVSVRQGSSPDS
ncbi:Fur family transcriptional regulator [Isoptericola cucumis]|uniref:Fur family transcriptional regulator n=1 Tax=Isoptericola cucumis TaxID=1776856 RepID=UPI00280AADFB|nr:Fur family transcriptional regulator [Isoptericola cucumis]